MSYVNLQNLDQLDRKILSKLLANGRESIANLSKNIGLSRTAVSERINRMEKTGVIKGYSAQIRIGNGTRTITSYLMITCMLGEKNNVVAALKDIPEIRSTSVVGGAVDIIALLEAPDLPSIHSLSNSIESLNGIKSLQNNVVLQHSSRQV